MKRKSAKVLRDFGPKTELFYTEVIGRTFQRFWPITELFYTEVIGRTFQRFWAENGTVLHRSDWTYFPKTVVTFKQIGYQEIRKMIFITTKIIVGVHILIYFGTSLVVGINDIPFCRKRLKELRQDEKDWSKRCLNGKDQNLDTPRCEAEKKYNHERRCMYTKICFYKGPYAEPYLLIKSKSEIHAIDLTTLNTTIVIGGIAGRTMDIDTVDNKLYIADNNSISRVNLDDICVEVILQNVSVGDMAIDWIGRRIFWTEYLEKQIFVADLGDKKKRVLIKTTSYPSGIAVDATMEYLFWTEPIAKFVRRISLVLNVTVTLANRKFSESYAITVDCTKKRVYWFENEIQSGVHHIFSSDYNGLDQKTIVSGSLNDYLLGVLGDSLYYLNNDLFYINETNVSNGIISRNILVDNNTYYDDLVVVHSSIQPQERMAIGKVSCDFEDPTSCKWTQDSSDEFDWTRRQGHIFSRDTGPTTDHTKSVVLANKNQGPGCIQHRGGKCIHVFMSGFYRPKDGQFLVVYKGCGESRLEFQLLPNGTLMHTRHGMCVKPVTDGVRVGVFSSCSVTDKWSWTAKGSLQYKKKMCLKPETGGSNPGDDIKLVLDSACNESQNFFEFVPIPVTNKNQGPGSIQHRGGNCIQVLGNDFNRPKDAQLLVVNNQGCGKSRLEFQLWPNGTLMLTRHGMCVKPVAGGVRVGVFSNCDATDKWSWTAQRSLQYKKKMCLKAEAGESNPGNNVRLVLGSACNKPQNVFEFLPTRGWYLYIETKSPRRLKDTARFISPSTTEAKSCLSFFYYMYGTEVAKLQLYVKSGGKMGLPVWSRSRNRGNKWYQAQVAVNNRTASYQYVIEGVRGKAFKGDIAIDDISLRHSCTAGEASLQPLIPAQAIGKVTCDFEDPTSCKWTQDSSDEFDWTRHQGPTASLFTGPTTDHTEDAVFGWYLYIETSSPRQPNDTARLISPSTTEAKSCLFFFYYMYGRGVGKLQVYVKSGGKMGLPMWSRSGNHGNKWYQAQVAVNNQTASYQYVIEGVRGKGIMGDIAIDDISLRHSCTAEENQPSKPTSVLLSNNGSKKMTTTFTVSTTPAILPSQTIYWSEGDEWPSGSYGLPRPKSGCPSGKKNGWREGWRYHDMEDTKKNTSSRSRVSSGSHMDVTITRLGRNINRTFCMKENTGIQTRFWPKGSYCIYKIAACPKNMTSGWVRWDDEDYSNRNSNGGYLPDGSYDKDTEIQYCCQTGGHWYGSIELPVSHSFYLLTSSSTDSPKCQMVKWAFSYLEYIVFDTEDDNNRNDQGGEHLFLYGETLYYCYYEDCHRTMTGPSASFRSHKAAVTEMDRRSQYCSWLITVAETYIVSLSFKELTIPSCNDTFLRIYDGSNDTAPLLGTYCGSNASTEVVVLSSTNSLYIVSNSGSYARSPKNTFIFHAQYKAENLTENQPSKPTSVDNNESSVSKTVTTTSTISTTPVAEDKGTTDDSSRIIIIASTMGAGVFLCIVLIVLLIKYKRRKRARKLSTPVNIPLAVATPQESLPIDQEPFCETVAKVNREFYDVVATNANKSEDISSEGRALLGVPSNADKMSEYKTPVENEQQEPGNETVARVDREFYNDVATNANESEDTSAEGRTSDHEEVEVPSNEHKASGYTELNKQPDTLKREATGDDDSDDGYVIPAPEEPQDETPGKNETYEEPKISPENPGYAELDKNRLQGRNTTEDGTYEKLLKRDSDYVIPADERRESYEDIRMGRNLPGYTELDLSKREAET